MFVASSTEKFVITDSVWFNPGQLFEGMVSS